MNILIVVTKGELGGAQSSVLHLARFLSSQGHFVTVGFGDGTFLHDALIASGIQTVQFKYLRRTYNPFKNLLFVRELQKHVDMYDTDVVHFNSSNALFGSFGAKHSRRKPATVFTVRGLSMLDPAYHMHPIVRRAYFTLFKFFFQWIDAVVFVSKSNQDTAQAQKLVHKGHVIYNGVDIAATKVLPRHVARQHILERMTRNKSVASEDLFLIGSIGRLVYQKNYEFLIHAFPEVLKKNPNAKLVIVGEGPERAHYEKLIKKFRLEDTVYLIGEIEFAARYISAFDLFVLPSRYEGMSITMLETVSVGIPILASDVAGNAEIVDNDMRQLHVLNDTNDFLNKIEAFFKSESLRSAVSRHNTERGKEFHIKNTGSKYQALYKALIKKRV